MISWKQFGIGVAGLLVTFVAYQYVRLENKVVQHSSQIHKLSHKLDVLISVVSMKIPEINLPNMVNIATEKNIDAGRVKGFLPLAEKDPNKAKSYLRDQMQFNEQEINLVINPNR